MKTVVVLGGGGVRGMAHAGAWRALREAGVEPVAIVGTSIGSLVAACIGGGNGYGELRRKALEFRKQDIAILNRWVVLLNGIRQPGVFRGDTLRAYVGRMVPAVGVSELAIPVAVNAVDLGTGEQVWFGAAGRSDVALAECGNGLLFTAAVLSTVPAGRQLLRRWRDPGPAAAGACGAARGGADHRGGRERRRCL